MKMAALADVYSGGTGWALLTESDPARSVVRQCLAVASADLARKRDVRLARMITQGAHTGKVSE